MATFGKKTRNPGYDSGNNWVVCDRCGFACKGSDAKSTWDGLIVCPEDWEPRHEQDFVRSRKDRIVASVIRTEPEDIVIQGHLRSGIAGIAIAGLAFAGYPSDNIPESTFNSNTL